MYYQHHLDAAVVFQAAREGDKAAQDIVETTANYFKIGIANKVLTFLPDMIVLGGGVMKSIDLLMPAIEDILINIGVMVPSRNVQIKPAHLGNHAGLFGAAYSIKTLVNGERL